MPLHTDFRPQEFEDFIGNRSTIESLKSVVTKKNPPHSYLFTGPKGCGKTTLGRLTAKKLKCEGFDFIELDTAQFGNIDQIRNIRRKMNNKSLHGGNRGWMFDEVHMLGEGGASEKNKPQAALLKALEEPPAHVFFFLCTTDPQRLLPAIRSRCIEFEVSPLTKTQMVQLLSDVSTKSGIEVPQEVMEQIFTNSQGSPRDALTILEKVIGLPEKRMLRAAQQSLLLETKTKDLYQAIIKRRSWNAVSAVLKGLGKEDPESVRRYVLECASNDLVNTGSGQAYVVLDSFREPFYNTGRAGLVLACYESVES